MGDEEGAHQVARQLGEALVWVLEGDLDRAESVLREVAALDSDQATAYLALARVYRRRGEIGRAIQIHQNLLLRKGLSADERLHALRGLAEDFRSGGFLRRAEAAFREALALRADDPASLRGLLRILEDRGELRAAAEIATRLARQVGERDAWLDAERWCAIAKSEYDEGHERDARKAISRALRQDADHGAAWLLLGTLEAERGRTRKALKAWRRAAACDAESAAAAYPRIEATHAALGRSRDTERFLREVLERDPGDVHARLALSRALTARGEGAEALELLDKAGQGSGTPLALGVERCRLLLEEEPEALRAAVETLLDRLERETRSG